MFLTIIFLLFFAMVGVTFDSVRNLSSVGYVRAAAVSAAATVFGEYNRELYEEYGLFAYGGANGKDVEDLEDAYQRILTENISCRPANTKEKFVDLYSFRDMTADIQEVSYLIDSKEFLGQVQVYLKQDTVQNLTDVVQDKITSAKDDNLFGKLEMTNDYEKGKYDKKEAEDEKGSAISIKGGKIGDESHDLKNQNDKNNTDTEPEDLAGGNPLKTFTDLARDGVLGLVCDKKKLSNGVIEPRSLEESENHANSDVEERKEDTQGETKAAQILSDFMSDAETDTTIVDQSIEKAELLCYANKMLSSYTNDCNRTTKYGLEYLVGGKTEEKSNLAGIVNRLLVIRMLLNFTYVIKDAVLQKKSLATATAIAGVTGLAPVISAVQYTILLILSFQEACIDVTALLEGRQVPVTKNSLNFKMKYEEICVGTKKLFHKKAETYPKAEGMEVSSGLTYQQYLWLFMLLTSRDTLEKRVFDLIQYDLRQKYNQTFRIDTCICASGYQIQYQIPFLFVNLPYIDASVYQQDKSYKSLEVRYGYKSK